MIPVYRKHNPYHPAFFCKIPAAIKLVETGSGKFIKRNTAVQLKCDHMPELRDISANIQAEEIFSYCIGVTEVRIAVDCGWGHG